MPAPLTVAALYRFARFADPAALRAPLLELAEAQGIRGTLILAREGINGTIAGTTEGIAAIIAHIRALPGCADPDVKYSAASEMPFGRLKVRLKREIVTMGCPTSTRWRASAHTSPRTTGTRLSAIPRPS